MTASWRWREEKGEKEVERERRSREGGVERGVERGGVVESVGRKKREGRKYIKRGSRGEDVGRGESEKGE